MTALMQESLILIRRQNKKEQRTSAVCKKSATDLSLCIGGGCLYATSWKMMFMLIVAVSSLK